VRFRLSDETVWTSEFTADDASGLARGIAGAWDARIELTRRNPGATHPAFALAERMAEIARWEAERSARATSTEEQRRSWAAQVCHWRHCARRDLGGDTDTSPLRLHAWAPGDPGRISVWSTLCARTMRGGWACSPMAPRVPRVISADVAAELWDGAVAMADWCRQLDSFADRVGDAVRSALHPRPTLVR